MRKQISPALSVSLALIAGGALAIPSLVTSAAGQGISTVNLVAIDAIMDGNDATTLGPLDGCVSADVDSDVTVDVTVDAVPEDRPMIGFQIVVTYDPAILEATDVDNEYLLASKDAYEPIEGLSDELPDSDGSLQIAVADIASDIEIDASLDSGPGVLSRITFRAVAEGTSDVALSYDPPDAYPAIIDDTNSVLQVDNIGAAVVSVGQDCPPDAEPALTPLPSLDELQPSPAPTTEPPSTNVVESDSDLNVGLLIGTIALAAVGLVAVGGGAFLLRRRLRP
jgi:hypothetical protein